VVEFRVWDAEVQVRFLPLRFFFIKILMISQLVIYTRDQCEYCRKLKVILDSFTVKYTHYKLGVDFDGKAFYNEFGEGATFPRVTLDGSTVGGCNETIEYLTSIGCLQEQKDMECMV